MGEMDDIDRKRKVDLGGRDHRSGDQGRGRQAKAAKDNQIWTCKVTIGVSFPEAPVNRKASRGGDKT